MKSFVWRYGLWATIGSMLMFLISIYVFWRQFRTQEYITYSVYLLFLVMVYLGVTQYRDKENGGAIRFGQALKMGLLIVLIPSLFTPVLDIIYTNFIDPGFFDAYFAYALEKLPATLSPEELAARKAEMTAQKEFFSHPLVNYLFTFAVFFSGGIVSAVLCATFVRKQSK